MKNKLPVTAILLCFLSITLVSCKSSKNAKNDAGVNSEFNQQYIDSRGALTGTLIDAEYKLFKDQLKKELAITIPESKSILINYRQKSNNCLGVGFKKSDVIGHIENAKEISGRLSATYNMANYFVFTEDAHYADLYSKRVNYKKDPGYFKDRIFTSNQNCSAFLLVKPNGKFMKYYGEDYFTFVKNFLLKD